MITKAFIVNEIGLFCGWSPGGPYVTVWPIMIRLLVREIAEREGIQNPYQLADRTGLKYESCRLLWHGTSRQLNLRTIELLCRSLMILPGQLFELVPRLGEAITAEDLQPKSKAKKRSR